MPRMRLFGDSLPSIDLISFFSYRSRYLEVRQRTSVNFFQKWLQDHTGLIRLVLLLFVGLNLFSAHRMFSVSLSLALAHVLVAAVLLLGAILIR